MTEKQVITSFVVHLAQDHPGLQVDCLPDEENRSTQDIDAIAGPFAIEHTSIDTVEHQRRDSDWFLKVVGGLEEELSPLLPFNLTITLDYNAVKSGQDWSAIGAAIRAWVHSHATHLPIGNSVVDNVPDVPFPMRVSRSDVLKPGLGFCRIAPEENDLAERVAAAVQTKSRKLSKYAVSHTTILLLENGDIALMNNLEMLDAVKSALMSGLPQGVNQVWFADTSFDSGPVFVNFTDQIATSNADAPLTG